jgi:hypothetical protein
VATTCQTNLRTTHVKVLALVQSIAPKHEASVFKILTKFKCQNANAIKLEDVITLALEAEINFQLQFLSNQQN